MPVKLPPEVWSRVFFFVVPPLPFVGMENKSFAEDAERWRGADDVKGRWRDIDNLMLVSKTINELVGPFFWSYLVLTTSQRAGNWHAQLLLRTKAQRTTVYSFVQVVQVPNDIPVKNMENDCCKVLRKLSKLIHVHLHSRSAEGTSLPLLISLSMRSVALHVPLQGLTGLVVGTSNWEAVTLALRHLAPSLRQLEISTADRRAPTAALSAYVSAQKITFSSLVGLQTSSSADQGESWLDASLAARWTLPDVKKLAVGSESLVPSTSKLIPIAGRWSLRDRIYLKGLADVNANLFKMAVFRPKELAFGLGVCGQVALPDPGVFKATLDKVSPRYLDSISVVVTSEGPRARTPLDAETLCLVEFVNRQRLPSLKKIVWVAKSRDTREMNWPGTLMAWLLDLTKAGVDVVVQ